MPVKVGISFLSPDIMAPQYSTEGASGLDLRAVLPEPVTIEPGRRRVIGTGLRLSIPAGYEAQVRSRSGLAAEQGLLVLNSPGTIDSDYRGEVKVILANLGELAAQVRPGDRIAQLVFSPVARVEFSAGFEENDSRRGAGGFGHTGID